MYRDLGFIRVWGGESGDAEAVLSRDLRGAPYAYLVYPHRPIVAYLPQTGRLLNEYCVEFPDETRPYGSSRLPDSDDVLAKWMALKGDERRIIAEANLHLPGRQVDPRQIQRDLWRLGRWERERLVVVADALEVGARGGAVAPFGKGAGAMLEVELTVPGGGHAAESTRRRFPPRRGPGARAPSGRGARCRARPAADRPGGRAGACSPSG